MMETEQDCPSRHVSAQSAKDFLATIWLELLDWGAIALNSAGRFLTALFNCVMLGIATIFAVFAVIVLILLDKSYEPLRRFDVFTHRYHGFLEEDAAFGLSIVQRNLDMGITRSTTCSAERQIE